MYYIAFFLLLFSYTAPSFCMQTGRQLRNPLLATTHLELPNIGEVATQKLIEHLAAANDTEFTLLLERNENVLSNNQIGILLERSIAFARYAIASKIIERYGNILENYINNSVPHNNDLSTNQILTYWLTRIRPAHQSEHTH